MLGVEAGRWLLASIAMAGIVIGSGGSAAEPGGLPEIRSQPANKVPACVTPERLMAFVATRNTTLAPKFSGIAAIYRELGDSARVRWDYAFFQMLLETNYLMYRRGDGSSGDVGLAQNNFAGIGATGGGVPGDRYGDVRTGVLAHMQHLVAYSGERVDRPVAKRTREAQDFIIDVSHQLKRPVTFADLSHRWAVDRGYARNIETIASLFRRTYCTSTTTAAATATIEGRPKAAFVQPSKLGAEMTAVSPPEPQLAQRPLAEHPLAERSLAEHPLAGHPSAKSLVRTIWRRGDPVPPAPQAALPRSPTARHDETARHVEPIPEPRTEAVAPQLPNEVDAPAMVEPVTGVARFAMAAEAGVAAGMIDAKNPAASPCRIYSASYGGAASVLIRSKNGAETRLTAVGVAHEQRDAMAENFVANHAPGGEVLGHYDTKAAAVTAARSLCPAG